MKRKKPLSENAAEGDLLILKQEIVSEIDVKLEKIRKDHKSYRDEVMTKLDDISGQIEDLQEDKTLSIHQSSQLREEVEGHEERIKNLEKVQQTA